LIKTHCHIRLVLFFLQAVNVIVYAFAGVVKINEDWLRAEPLRHWLAKRGEYVLPLLLMVL